MGESRDGARGDRPVLRLDPHEPRRRRPTDRLRLVGQHRSPLGRVVARSEHRTADQRLPADRGAGRPERRQIAIHAPAGVRLGGDDGHGERRPAAGDRDRVPHCRHRAAGEIEQCRLGAAVGVLARSHQIGHGDGERRRERRQRRVELELRLEARDRRGADDRAGLAQP